MAKPVGTEGARGRAVARACLFLALFFLSGRSLFGATCQVVRHAPPTNADKALLAANYAQAEDLYRAALAASPGNPEPVIGLVHAMLRDQKIQEASDAVNAALAAAPNSAALITLRGEVELRAGEPWTAARLADQSYHADPCLPAIHLLLADLFRINSFYASAQHELILAHKLDPEDPDIRGEWMMTLPRRQRIAEIESYLAEPRGDDAEDLRHLRDYLDHLKRLETQPQQPCRLVSQTTATQLPFADLMSDANTIQSFGLEVKLNNRKARLEIDTGAGGLVINSSVAKHAGLQAFSQNEVGGVGDQGNKRGYMAYASSIRIGDLEFANCAVQVVDSRYLPGDVDGLIGMNVFSRFLVTLDYPMRKLTLGPLPSRPGEEATAALRTGEDDDVASNAPPAASSANAPPSPGGATGPIPVHGPYDRYIAPEMKDYTKIYRVGPHLIIPATLNRSSAKLFILDTGAFTTIISPEAAREVTKVHSGAPVRVEGLSGSVNKLYSADAITFRFADLSQKCEGLVAFDTSKISKDEGMQISGFLGATTLGQLTIHIDYRDGLVKFDYDPRRGYHY